MAARHVSPSDPRPPTLVDRLLPWLRPSLTRRNLQTFVRCNLVFLASLVLLVNQRTLNAIGQAAFFT